MTGRRVGIPALLPILIAVPLLAAAASVQTGDHRLYAPPVAAPVSDPFRPPANPWEPGNRGIEYSTAPGTRVGAIGPGVVIFAGPVAGSLHVTIRHPDGLRSSYSYLAAIRTSVGTTVGTGTVVGRAADRLHLGVRSGDRYIDPASLWGRPVSGGHVRLVPDGPSGHPARAVGPLDGSRSAIALGAIAPFSGLFGGG